MADKFFAKKFKNGINGFSANTKSHEDALLERILNEVEFSNEISDDDLMFLNAAGTVDAQDFRNKFE